jgi:hypothetical protein
MRVRRSRKIEPQKSEKPRSKAEKGPTVRPAGSTTPLLCQ